MEYCFFGDQPPGNTEEGKSDTVTTSKRSIQIVFWCLFVIAHAPMRVKIISFVPLPSEWHENGET